MKAWFVSLMLWLAVKRLASSFGRAIETMQAKLLKVNMKQQWMVKT